MYEAPIDALSLASCGYPALALIGCSAPEWLRLATAYRHAFLATDADRAGDLAAQVLAALLAAFGARCERLRPDGAKDWNAMLQELGSDGLADWLASRLGILPNSNEQRLHLANEMDGILQVLAGAKRLKNGGWCINGERYEHDEAVLLAAHTRGATTNSYPLEFVASQLRTNLIE